MDFGRESDFEAVVLSEGGKIENFGNGIDVALHEMAAEPISDGKGAFEVDAVAL